jgi:hypothetical protein
LGGRAAGPIGLSNMKELKRHISVHLGKGFCPTRRSVDMLSNSHSKVTYGRKEFTYNNRDKAEIVEWTEKQIDKEICIYLQCHLEAQSITPSDFKGVQVVVGGDHRDTAFQFGASVSVQLKDNMIIPLELVCCELICRKDTSRLIKEIILNTLTAGLKIVATWYLNVKRNGEGQMLCKFKDTQCTNDSHDAAIYCRKATVYITGNLAFQAMALGKESMAGWWCMLV